MAKLFKKELWKDIAIMGILLGVSFLEYTTLKKIKWFLVLYCIVATVVTIYALFYTLYNCKDNKQRKKMFWVYSISLLFLFYRDMMDIFSYLLIAFIFKDNRKEFLNSYFYISVSIMAFVMILYYFEAVPVGDVNRGDIYRYSLGFVHPNTVFRYYFGSLMALFLMDEKKKTFNIYALCTSIPLYILTNSRTGIICSFLFILLSNISIIFPKLLPKINLKWGYLAFAIFTLVFVSFTYNSNYFNSALSGRPGLLFNILKDADWHLLYGYMRYSYCDNIVVYRIVRDGILSLAIVIAFYYFAFRKQVSGEIKIIFIMSMIYGLTERFTGVGQNILPILAMWILYDNYYLKTCDRKEILQEG